MKNLIKLSAVAMATLALAVAGCGGDDDAASGDGGEESMGGGTYTLTINAVDDGCYDGAMTLLIIPDPANPPTIAGVALPAGGTSGTVPTIAFNPPFKPVNDVAVEADGANGLKTTAPIPNPDTNIAAAGGTCLADIAFTATLAYTTDDAFAGTGTMTVSNVRDDTGECPALDDGDTCEINITLAGAK